MPPQGEPVTAPRDSENNSVRLHQPKSLPDASAAIRHAVVLPALHLERRLARAGERRGGADVKRLQESGANNNHMLPGWSVHEEIQELVKIGLTPADVLRMATLNAAEWRNRSASDGTIDVGKVADLVLLRNNPLQDIRHTRDIDEVFASGKYYDQ